MPLLAGTTTVTAGVSSGTGLSKELFDALRSQQSITEQPLNQVPLAEMAKFCNTIASVVISHITTNATITASAVLTVASGIAVATTGTAAAQAGATTAPGTATGTVTSTIT